MLLNITQSLGPYFKGSTMMLYYFECLFEAISSTAGAFCSRAGEHNVPERSPEIQEFPGWGALVKAGEEVSRWRGALPKSSRELKHPGREWAKRTWWGSFHGSWHRRMVREGGRCPAFTSPGIRSDQAMVTTYWNSLAEVETQIGGITMFLAR